MLLCRLSMGAWLAFGCACAQDVITTFAGSDWVFAADGRAALNAPLSNGLTMVGEADGSILIADSRNNIVVRLGTDGILRVVAGTSRLGFSGDGGPATVATLRFPVGVAIDSQGNIYIGDANNNRIRRVSPAGIITTFAGTGVQGFSGDGGQAASATFSGPGRLKFDAGGNLYVHDSGNRRIRRITPAGIITTVAGNGQGTAAGDGGPAINASFVNANDFALDRAGNLYIADFESNRVRRVTAADGIINVYAGTGTLGFSGDGGPVASANLRYPNGVAVDSADNVYISDSNNNRIRRVTPAGIISTFAGPGLGYVYAGDGGQALQASFSFLGALAFDPAGRLLVVDHGASRLRAISTAGIVSTIAGNGTFRYFPPTGQPAIGAYLDRPVGLALDRAGSLFVADNANSGLYRIASGILSTLAGNTLACFGQLSGGPVQSSGLCGVQGITVDAGGDVYLAETGYNRVRRITSAGLLNTLAGIGTSVTPPGFSGDGGPAVQAALNNPNSVAIDRAGIAYIADSGNHRIRRVSGGNISTFAGSGTAGFAGDNGPATAAQLNFPTGVALDDQDNLYIADRNNNRIRRIATDGNITTVAGTGTAGFSGDNGPATGATLRGPTRIALDAARNLYIADMGNNRIRLVTAAGVIRTIAGNGRGEFTGDGGPALQAGLAGPSDVAIDSLGNLYIADTFNSRIRIVQPASTPSACGYTISTRSQSFSAKGGSGSLLVGARSDCPWQALDLPFWITALAGTSGTGPGVFPFNVAENTDGAPRAAVLTIAGERFIVRQAGAPPLIVDPSGITMAFALGSNPVTRTLSVSISGAGSLPFTATASTISGGAWLTVAPASATATAATPASITLGINPRALGPGTYNGQVELASPVTGEVRTVPVNITVSRTAQSLLLSQTGLSFRAVAGGRSTQSQSVSVVNSGSGAMSWTASKSTITGGSDWLLVSPASGQSTAGAAPPALNITVNPTNLALGDYYGQVQVTSAQAANSPQSISVVFSIVAADAALRPTIEPNGLVFTGAPGGTNPAAQTAQILNVTAAPVNFTVTPEFVDRAGWFTFDPASGTANPGAPILLRVQPNTTGFAAGVYRASLQVRFDRQTTPSTVDLLLVVSDGVVAADKDTRAASANCTPQRLLPLFLSPERSFGATAGWPSAIRLRILDDCGQPMISGQVSATFSNNDPSLVLAHAGSGLWSATWPARNSALAQVTITVRAQNPETRLEATAQTGGGVAVNPNPPIVAAGGVLNSASFSLQAPVSPGSLVSVFGLRLSETLRTADALPLLIEMAGTLATLAGQPLPLVYTSDGQVNAMIPYGIEQNTTLQLLVRRTGSLSVPEPVLIAPAQPAVFTVDGSGRGQGHIYRATAEGAQILADGASPVKPGDVLVIYSTGLGTVDPPVAAGAAAPFSPLSGTSNPVTVTIGNVEATVLFAGLTPAFTGLYQVNVIVPERAPSGSDVPLIISLAGQNSPPVGMAVR